MEQENENEGEQEASAVQRDKQKEINKREKLLFWGKKREISYPFNLWANSDKRQPLFESCGGVRSGSPT